MNESPMNGASHRDNGDPAPGAELWVCSGRHVGRRYRFDDTPRILGRAGDCDIVVEDERASQRHARLWGQGGSHFIEDLGSTNGTYVNQHRVQRAELAEGDLVQIGETVYEYVPEHGAPGTRTSRGTRPTSDQIPQQIRSGAQQMLARARNDHPVPHQPGPQSGGYGPQSGGYGPQSGGFGPRSGGLGPESHGPRRPLPPVGPVGGQYGGGEGPPPYHGHYSVPADDGEGGGGTDLIAILLRVKQIVLLYWPYWPIAVALAFVGVIFGAVHFRMNPPPESASFQILLRRTGAAGALGGDGEALVFFDDQVIERFRSPPVVEAALERITGEVATPEDVDSVMTRLAFWKMGAFHSNTYAGHMIAAKAEEAVQYLRTHLDIWLERELELGLGPVKADVAFFRDELERAAKELEDAENALAKYKTEHPDVLPTQSQANYDLLFSLQQDLSTLQAKIAALEASRREHRRSLSSMERLTTGGLTQTNPYQADLARINGELAAARAAGKGDDHPDVRRLLVQRTEVEQLAQDPELNKPTAQIQLNQSYVTLQQTIQSEGAQLQALREEERKLVQRLEKQKSRIGQLPAAEAEFQELLRRYETAQENHAALLRKLKNAEIKLDRQRARVDAQFQLLMAPRPDLNPVGGSRKKRLLMGGAMGFALGFLLVTILLFRSGRLTLGLILGRDLGLDVLLGRTPVEAAPTPGTYATELPGQRPTNALPARTQQNDPDDEATETFHRSDRPG